MPKIKHQRGKRVKVTCGAGHPANSQGRCFEPTCRHYGGS